MPTNTTTYSFQKPVVGADEDSWGGYLNSNWDKVDDLFDGTVAITGIDINSGTIDGTVIGGSSAAAGTFTTLTATSTATFAGLTTTADITFGDNDKAIFGAGSDLQIYHDGTNSYIDEAAAGDLYIRAFDRLKLNNYSDNAAMLNAKSGAEVELYYNGGLKLATTATGVDVTGVLTTDGISTSADITFGDNDKAIFGAGSDLQIYHDTANSNIRDVGTGFLGLDTNGSDVRLTSGSNAKIMGYFEKDGPVYLYYDGNGKLATTSTGVNITGTAVTDGVTVAGNLSVDGGTIKLDGNYPVGTGNVALGDAALDDGSLSGPYNVAIGNNALTSNSSGDRSIAIGGDALASQSTGSTNTVVGNAAMYANSTGSYNVALGGSALSSNTTASNNTAVGYQAGYSNTTGYINVFLGEKAGYSNTTGYANTAVGRLAQFSNTTGTQNTLIGWQSGYYNTTGSYNVALGGGALQSNTTASNNTAVGYQAGYSNTAFNNCFFGYKAGYANTTGTSLVAIGEGALDANTTANFNIGIGANSLGANTTGASNTAIGDNALRSNTTASNNTAVGYQAGYSNTSGQFNTSTGSLALTTNTTGQYNSAFGMQALRYNTNGSYNTAVGQNAMQSNTTASYNTAVGYQALYSYVSGSGENVAIGANALYSQTTGYENIGIGRGAGNDITTGIRNTLIGDDAGYLITTGTRNTIIGRYNGNQGGLDIRTSSNNIVLSDGDGSVKQHMDFHNRNVMYSTYTTGYGLTITNSASSGLPEGIDIVTTNVASDTQSGHFLRCSDSSAARCVIDLNGSLRNHDNSYGGISDQRAKQDIVDAASQWDDVKAIQVRKYKKIDDVTAYGDAAPVEIGVIAQELEASGMSGLVDTPENPDEMKSVKYSILYMKAVKALQEAMDRIETLEAKVTALENA
jgi:hypothetical protein